jgi:oligopeptide transport system substrate-binding protein
MKPEVRIECRGARGAVRLVRSFGPALLSVLLLVSGCSRHEPEAVRAGREGTMLIGNGGDPPDLDPQTAVGAPEIHIVESLFEGLVNVDPADLHPMPGVARSWDVSADGMVYTFHLRSDARWSNGDPVTAMDFAESFKRLLSPAFASENADQFYVYVAGAEDYFKNRQTDFSKVGIRVLDPLTLAITLNHPAPFFPQLLSERYAFPVPVAVISRFGGVLRRGSPWTRPGNMVCNGPFVLKAWLPNQYVEVGRSPTYWNRSRVRLGAVRFYAIEELAAEEASFRSGQLHKTESIPAERVAVYRSEKSPLLRIAPLSGVYYYSFNTRRPPFDDVRVRRALAMALDRESIVRDVTRGGQMPAYSLVPGGLDGYTTGPRIPRDADGARQLLAEAGFPGGRGFPQVTLLYNTSEGHRAVAEAIQQIWRKSLKIDIDLYNQEWKVYLDNMHMKNYQICRAGLVIDPYDPYQYLRAFEANSGFNDTGWSNPDYDRILEKAIALPDRASRFALYRQAEEILLRDMPILPIFFYTRQYLIRQDVRDWTDNLLENFPLGQAWLQE